MYASRFFFFAKTQTHTTHTLSTPAVAEYLPAGHDVQAAAAEEVDPAGPCVPAAHTEPEQVEAPTTAEYLPASQLVQTVEPAIYVHTLSHTTKGGAR